MGCSNTENNKVKIEFIDETRKKMNASKRLKVGGVKHIIIRS